MNDKTPLPPMPPAKVSTASEQSTTKKRGGVVCEGCGEVILGKLIAGSAGMVWHPKCYKCTTCGLQLEHVSPYEQEGKLYCHFDYHELFTTRCYTCKTPIVDERFFTVNSPSAPTLPRYYHELHFFCSECGDPFLDPLRSTAAGGTGRDEEEDQGIEEEMKIHWWKDHPFCEKCDVKLHNPKCAKCRLALEGEYLEALGGKWHPGCLVCDVSFSFFVRAPFDASDSPFRPVWISPSVVPELREGVREWTNLPVGGGASVRALFRVDTERRLVAVKGGRTTTET
ncbi:hypothetical protein BDY24DRAFT_403294 [Mrakia frigida]|uniref:LIM domain-containing protein n=1 Tax=Mrakia frigida TaxID=29902 RepID=UPI003FCC1BB8